MTASVPPTEPDARDETGALIADRARLKEWLARLDEHAGDTPHHILERVREDYRERLRQAAEQLVPRLDGLRQELEALRAQQAEAAERHTGAVDTLAEIRLRQLVGEIAPEAGTEREAELDQEVRAAEAESARLAAEVDRLAAVVAGIESDLTGTAPEPTGAEEVTAEEFTAEEFTAEEFTAATSDAADVPTSQTEDPQEASAAVSDEKSADMAFAEAEAADPAAADDEVPILAAPEEAGPEEPELEQTVTVAVAPEGEAREPLGSDGEGSGAAEPEDEPVTTAAEVAPEEEDAEAADDLPWLELIDARADEEDDDTDFDAEHQEFLNWIAAEVEPAGGRAELPVSDAAGGEDLEFLEELDRALQATVSTPRRPAAANGASGESETDAATAVRYCRACGSDNDARAWYCEICGEELA